MGKHAASHARAARGVLARARQTRLAAHLFDSPSRMAVLVRLVPHASTRHLQELEAGLPSAGSESARREDRGEQASAQYHGALAQAKGAVLGGLGQAMQRRSCATRVNEMDECAMARNVPRARAHLEVKSASWLQPRLSACSAITRCDGNRLEYSQVRNLGPVLCGGGGVPGVAQLLSTVQHGGDRLRSASAAGSILPKSPVMEVCKPESNRHAQSVWGDIKHRDRDDATVQ